MNCPPVELWFIALAVVGAVTAVAIPCWLAHKLLMALMDAFAGQDEDEARKTFL